MMGNATVQVQKRESLGTGPKYFIYLPESVVKQLAIQARDIVSFDMKNEGMSKMPKREHAFKPKVDSTKEVKKRPI